MRNLFMYLFISLTTYANAQQKNSLMTPFELDSNYSASYYEAIEFYQELSKKSALVKMEEVGTTDAGKPLHIIIISSDGDFDPQSNHDKGKTILFVNNAIHPGEPCGVDASMMFARDMVTDRKNYPLLEKTTLVMIPFYNIGGGLNRGSHSRANQNGPKLYGFRGNAKNLDLNRDFVKMDSHNAMSFNKAFNKWQPHVFIDNHTSNGSDYQYTITLIATQKDKLAKPVSELMTNSMLPFLYADMEKRNWEMIPYVYARTTPDKGIIGFNETPRYSTGYAALHHTIGFMPETHMLKPFKDRVMSVYHFMHSMMHYMADNQKQLITAKRESQTHYANLKEVPLNWSLDQDALEQLDFKGYTPKQKPSDISGFDRLYYDHEAPFDQKIDFRNTYKADLHTSKPKMYIIPQAYSEVIDRLKLNRVEMHQLEADQVFSCDVHFIKDYSSRTSPYESHYLHYGVELDTKKMELPFFKGDYIIETGQASDRLIIELLEPNAPDSYFAWNFFDGILMQKEHFSPYVFEDLAVKILQEQPEIEKALNDKKLNDEDFAKDASAQLDFIYLHSEHYEPTYLRYPIGRVFE